MDFGLAKVLDENDVTIMTRCGTLHYVGSRPLTFFVDFKKKFCLFTFLIYKVSDIIFRSLKQKLLKKTFIMWYAQSFCLFVYLFWSYRVGHISKQKLIPFFCLSQIKAFLPWKLCIILVKMGEIIFVDVWTQFLFSACSDTSFCCFV